MSLHEITSLTDVAYKKAEAGKLTDALDIFNKILIQMGMGEEREIWLQIIECLYDDPACFNPNQMSSNQYNISSPCRKLLAAGAGWSGSSAVFDYYRNFECVSAIPGEFMHINGKYGLHGLMYGDAISLEQDQKPDHPIISLRELRNSFRYCFFGITGSESSTQKKHAKNAKLFTFNGGANYAYAVGRFIANVIAHGFERKAIAGWAETFIDECCKSRLMNVGDFLALDNVLPSYRLETIKLFSNIRVALVMRDPRDQYVDNKINNKKFTRNVAGFSRFYRKVREYTQHYEELFGDRVKIISFDEFVLSTDYRNLFAEWAGLDGQINSERYFIAEKSKKNISLYKNKEFNEDVAYIENKLMVYCTNTVIHSSLPKKNEINIHPSNEHIIELLQTLKNQTPSIDLLGKHLHKSTTPLQKEFKKNQFLIYPTLGEYITLTTPIDWNQDPFLNRSWSSLLHSLKFLGVGMGNNDKEMLEQTRDIALDWIAQNPKDSNNLPAFAWSEKIVGDRVQVLAYLFRLLASEELLTPIQAENMLKSLKEHGEFLSSDKNYHFGHNHGLAQDIGLYVCGIYLSFLPESSQWRAIALSRFLTGVNNQYSKEGIHLEHSPGYHFIVLKWIFKMQALVLHAKDPAVENLEAIKNKILAVSPWLTTPDGLLLQIGDSKKTPVSESLLKEDETAYGLKAFDAGYAIVREKSSYLFLIAGHHSPAHKQSDDLSFMLVESGQPIITEAGSYGYGKRDLERRYVESVWGHNVLIVDNKDFNTKKYTPPYGSSIIGVSEAQNWKAICACNPVLANNFDVTHYRIILFKPTEQLIVIDLMKSTQDHAYTSIVHFDSEAQLTLSDNKINFNIGNQQGIGEWFSSEELKTSLFSGHRKKELKGWVVTDYMQLEPAPTLEAEVCGKNAFIGLSLCYGDNTNYVEHFKELEDCWEIRLGGSKPFSIKIQQNPFLIQVI